MRKSIQISVAFSCAALPIVLYAYASGPDPGNTGAPGDKTCAQSGCHIGTALNGGGGSVTLTSSAGKTYTPGQAQTLTVTITDSKARVYGFQMSARLDSAPTTGQAGDFTPGTQQIVLCSNGSLKGSSGCSSKAPLEFIEHSSPFKTNVISVNWTPPTSAVGTVTLYVAANAANGNGDDSGDHIYTTSLQLSPASATTGNKPAISSGGVVAASSFNASAGIAPGSWIEIYGNNLSTTTRSWASADFNGNNAPTSLDGVSVTIGGKAAFVDFVSPGQVDVQAPDSTPLGAGVQVMVTNSQGQSDPYTIQTASMAPALLAPPAFMVNGKQLVVATFPPTSSGAVVYVGPANAISGITMQPAKAGDVITLYGIGFGAVSSGGAGVITTAANSLNNPVTISINGTPATVLYAGLAPGFVGLYQFNVQVPGIAAGTWPLVVQQNGAAISQSTMITTQ